jgi:hypothetical protein
MSSALATVRLTVFEATEILLWRGMAPNTSGELLVLHRRVHSIFGGEKKIVHRK